MLAAELYNRNIVQMSVRYGNIFDAAAQHGYCSARSYMETILSSNRAGQKLSTAYLVVNVCADTAENGLPACLQSAAVSKVMKEVFQRLVFSGVVLDVLRLSKDTNE